MSSAPSNADSPSSSIKAYERMVRERIQGLPDDVLVAIAARAAWRVVPLMFAGWRDRGEQVVWWGDFGTSKLVLAILCGRFGDQIDGKAIAAAANINTSNDPVASAVAAKYKGDSNAAYVAAYVAVVAAASAAQRGASETPSRLVTSAGLSAITASINAFDRSPILGEWQVLASAIDADIDIGRRSGLMLSFMPLWPRSVGNVLVENWKLLADTEMPQLADAKLLHEWLVSHMWGKPRFDEMRSWFNDWWLKHPQNKDHTPAFADFPTPTPTESEVPLHSSESETPPTPIIEKTYKEPAYSVALASDGVAQTLTDTAEKCKEALRAFLACPETQVPITVSVEAPWGAGKTSFLHCLRGALEKKNHIPTVWFNPWKHEAGKTLWAAFAVAYERQMAEKLSWLGRWRRRAVLSWQRLSGGEQMLLLLRLLLWGLGFLGLWWLFTHGVSFAGDANLKILLNQHLPVLGTPLLLWGLVKDLVGSFGSPLKVDTVSVFTRDHHEESVDDLHRFHEDFARLMRAYTPGTGPLERFFTELRMQADPHWSGQWRYVLRALLMTACRWLRKACYTHLIGDPEALNEPEKPRWLKNRVVVFIDDLDRCEAPKAADVLQSLHLMLSGGEHERRENEPEPPGVICILGMDREKVAAAVAAKHEKLLPLLLEPEKNGNGKISREKALGFGHEFLEKFVQITLHLPGLTGADQEQFLRMITGWEGLETLESSQAVDLQKSAESERSAPTEPVSDDPQLQVEDPVDSRRKLAKRAAEVRWRRVEAEAAIKQVEIHLNNGESAFICASYVAEALEHNPRRLKQFVNLFRLRLYLAGVMHLLDIPTLDPTVKERRDTNKLSAHDIAKLVALDLCCPQTMAKVREQSSVAIDTLLARVRNEHLESRLSAISKMIDHKPADASSSDSSYDLGKAPLSRYFQQLASVALPAESASPAA